MDMEKELNFTTHHIFYDEIRDIYGYPFVERICFLSASG
ncbi:hypothetical protein Desgi_0527 [Desulfoscipio gibsoniae DSM 7213]|uniref:Uncharacterized protein n=1 Tax=Desulfoscipio gibsoniae DSM 7213 TaxID=767817 RepID=R4KC07_9FIRM|nr:hypothetical protein Desgi_0527 [Desulfoscipio gibsoniae DSM 7213]